MALKNAARRMPDSYFRLVKQFPLTHLRSEASVQAAQLMLDKLLEQDLDAGEREYVDALTDLVEIYEDEHEPLPDASEADVLRVLMQANGLNQTTLAKKAKISQSTLSAVLNGTRSLTRQQVVALAGLFHVSPAVFLPV